MSKLKVKLNRNLRRSILRGHPWVYRDAITVAGSVSEAPAELCKVFDAKGDLGWAIYDAAGPLALRFLNTTPKEPDWDLFESRMRRAYALRASIRSEKTTAYRLFNGEGDGLPGLVCDIYNDIAVVQFDGVGPKHFWDHERLAEWFLKHAGCESVIEKTRRNSARTTEHIAGKATSSEVEIIENDIRFVVNLEKGQKTGFFLDQRDNRLFVRANCTGKSLLNLFSYTGGFSVSAGIGRARRVASVDISQGAVLQSEENWALNKLPPASHSGHCADVFDFLQNDKELWDHIVVDPPSMSHSESQKPAAIVKYTQLFSAAARRVSRGGEISLSSCSSHIGFEDFFKIIDEALSLARRTGMTMRVSGQAADHPFPQACHELRYLKFVHLALD